MEKEQAGTTQVLTLPGSPLPVIIPSPARRATTDPEVTETVETDGWASDPSFLRSSVVANFKPKFQPLFAAADGKGQKMGNVHIPKDFWTAIDSLEVKFGAALQLRWRFVTSSGATVFSRDELHVDFQVSGRPNPGATSNHRAIWANRERIAKPAVEVLRSVGVNGNSYPEVTYRVDDQSNPPVLWLLYLVSPALGVFDSSEVLE